MSRSQDSVRATGGCQCGAIRYRVRGPLREVIACHCTQCRRLSGHHIAATATWRDALEVEGTEALTWYRASPEAARGFCSVCGSTLFWQADKKDYTAIFAGSLDEGAGVRLAAHIFVADKGDYYDIADGLPQHAGHDHDVRMPDG